MSGAYRWRTRPLFGWDRTIQEQIERDLDDEGSDPYIAAIDTLTLVVVELLERIEALEAAARPVAP